jgi:hypothetical protein
MPKVRTALAGIGVSGSLVAALLASGGAAAPIGAAAATGGAASARDGSARIIGVEHGAPAIAGPRLLGAETAAGAPRVGTPMGVGTTPTSQVDTMYSSNWSGVAATGGHVLGARGAWTVPKVQQSSTARYSSTWVGVDGIGNSSLIQTGTEQDTNSASAHPYFAWIEILPHLAVPVENPATGRLAVVRPGDRMMAEVEKVRTGLWTIYIRDVTRRWYFEKHYAYHGPGASAEWIVEAPRVDGVESHIAKFSHVSITDTGIYANHGSGRAWYSTALAAANRIDLRQQGSIKARPSVPLPAGGSPSGQHFTVRFEPT